MNFRLEVTLEHDDKLLQAEKPLPWYEFWGTVRTVVRGEIITRKVVGDESGEIGEYVLSFCENLLISLLDLVYGKEISNVPFRDSDNTIKIKKVSKDEVLLAIYYGPKSTTVHQISFEEYYSEIMRVVDEIIKQVEDLNKILADSESVVGLKVVRNLITVIRERQKVALLNEGEA